MKYREEPSNGSMRGEWSARQTDSVSRPGRTESASFEQPALGVFPEMLMEAVVSRSNIERAWAQVRGNKGAAGPDGITIVEFIAWARPQWESIVQQLLDGTYRPGPVRRDQRCASVPASTNRMAERDSSVFRTCWTVSFNRPSSRS